MIIRKVDGEFFFIITKKKSIN